MGEEIVKPIEIFPTNSDFYPTMLASDTSPECSLPKELHGLRVVNRSLDGVLPHPKELSDKFLPDVLQKAKDSFSTLPKEREATDVHDKNNNPKELKETIINSFQNTGCPEEIHLENFGTDIPSSSFNTGCPDEDDDVIEEEDSLQSESLAQDYLQNTKLEFSKCLKSIINGGVMDIETFESEASQKKLTIMEEFQSKMESFGTSTSLINILSTNLVEFIAQCIEDDVLLLQNEKTDRLNVRAPLLVAGQYYRDEMSKEFASEEKYLPNFTELNQRITAAAVRSCSDFELTPNQEKLLTLGLKSVQKEFKDRNFTRIPHNSVAIGIDLGTTYSCASVFQNGKVTVIPNELGKTTTPSCVAFKEDGSFLIGDIPKHSATQDPGNTSFDSKRLLGRSFNDPIVQDNLKIWPFKVVNSEESNTPKIEVHGKSYFPEEISARILQHMKIIAETYLQVPVENAVVTVPAHFNNSQRQATKDAGEIAGLNILKIINEPTAAAIAYQLQSTDHLQRNVLIFDLGGGTLDVAVLTTSGGKIQVKAVGGDTDLGGQDFDNEMVNYCIEEFHRKNNIDLRNIPKPASSLALRRIRNECEKQKCNLSSALETEISLYAIYKSYFVFVYDLHVPITRTKFEELNQVKFQRCMEVVEEVINDAHLKKEDINDVVLVGGSTRIPKIQQMLSKLLGGIALSRALNPDEAVAYGAALQASILNGKRHQSKDAECAKLSFSAKDVTPLSIGIPDGSTDKMEVLIPKNTEIPCEASETRVTIEDGQTEMLFQIYEGEDAVAEKNHLLGEFLLQNIPARERGTEEVEVKMEINGNGILHVTAIAKSNRSFSSVTIECHQGRLSKEQINLLKF